MVLTAKQNDTVVISGDMIILPKAEYEKLIEDQNSLKFMKKMEHSMEQSRNGHVVVKTMEELEAMADG